MNLTTMADIGGNYGSDSRRLNYVNRLTIAQPADTSKDCITTKPDCVSCNKDRTHIIPNDLRCNHICGNANNNNLQTNLQ